MARAYSQAAKRRHKKAAQESGLPEIAPSRKRTAKGQYSRAGQDLTDGKEDPRKTVLSKRCRDMGREVNRENRLALSAQIMGDEAGQAISIGAPRDAARLFKTFTDFDNADERYHRRILGRSRHAKCGKVEFMPERFEARDDETTDTRTEEEKDRAAVNAWMAWHGLLGHLERHEHTSIHDGMYLRGALHKGGVLTTKGAAFVAALRVLADVAERRH